MLVERTEVSVPSAHEREVLRQAGIALDGRIVTLWEISPTAAAVPLLSGISNPQPSDVDLDLEATLRRWGAPIVQKTRWVGCRLLEGGLWIVAPVRSRPAAPPPSGVERRSRERLVLELAGLSLGAIAAAEDGARRRLDPAEALWELARQPSVIAHEVGNPLAVALGNLDLGLDAIRSALPTELDGTFRTALLADLANVSEGIEQAAEYLRSIQDRPFGAAGRMARFDVTPVIRSCVTLERPLARKHGVALRWQTSVDSLYLYGDTGALYQVLTNLIRNAVDASIDHKAAVVVSLGRSGDSLTLGVQDTGAGIASEHLPKIFDRGFTTKPPGKGSGIGLAVVKEITEAMFGGTIQVDSRVGAGTTFTLLLPIPPQRNVVRPVPYHDAG
jgi:signal transduction histidine kinase